MPISCPPKTCWMKRPNAMFSIDDAKEILYKSVLRRRPDTPPEDTPVILDFATIEKPWGWVFFYNNDKFLETREFLHQWVGPGPIFFNRESGDIREFGSGSNLGDELEDYESELAAAGGQWCLWIDEGKPRAKAIIHLKNALAITTPDAAKMVPLLPCCLFSGIRRHLQWMADKLSEYSIDTRIDLQHGDDPAYQVFVLPEEMINPTAAQAFHHKWDVRGY